MSDTVKGDGFPAQRTALGMAIIDLIGRSSLIKVWCSGCESSEPSFVYTWSANAAEQLEALIGDYLNTGDFPRHPLCEVCGTFAYGHPQDWTHFRKTGHHPNCPELDIQTGDSGSLGVI